MLRPPTSGGRGESDFHDFDDVEITPKRGAPDSLPGDDEGNVPTGGPGGTGGGIDREPRDVGTRDRNEDLPERLGERIENGSSSSMAPGEPDVLPDVDPPDTTM